MKERNCSCVRLNRDINIYDMNEQEVVCRNGLGCGLVAETYSADRRCERCRGSGEDLGLSQIDKILVLLERERSKYSEGGLARSVIDDCVKLIKGSAK